MQSDHGICCPLTELVSLAPEDNNDKYICPTQNDMLWNSLEAPQWVTQHMFLW